MIRHQLSIFCLMMFSSIGSLMAQVDVYGVISSADGVLPYASVAVENSDRATIADANGNYRLEGLDNGVLSLKFSFSGYEPQTMVVDASVGSAVEQNVELKSMQLDEVVISGTLKEMKKLDSPVPIEVYQPAYFKRNPTPNMYDALQNVNGVRPQLNCNVCNTGDIHINGLEGPYTMILIDGMPIVGGLSSVYGLSGIPNSMIERIEVVKGPASTLYGSEAVGGLINVITKKNASSPTLAFDVFSTSWQEVNTDVSFKLKPTKRTTVVTGLNYFNYSNPIDHNKDQFTDVTLQDRISVFQRWNFQRSKNRTFNIAVRYLYEDRWGGQMNWTPEFRGGDSIYAESIYTNRWELVGAYQLPLKEKLLVTFSANHHDQNSVYGDTDYDAQQSIGFMQMVWDKKIGRHDFILGSAMRYTYYDDNTAATAAVAGTNSPSETWLPGAFFQDEISIHEHLKLLAGLRYDFNSNHGSILTPRAAIKWSPNSKNIFRINSGTGYRVVNLFTEEHAALTGARSVVIAQELSPETSLNVNVNYVRRFYTGNLGSFGVDITSWYTYFTNQILPDYDTDPDKIIYDNLDGHSVSRGAAINGDFDFSDRLVGNVGVSYIDVYAVRNVLGETQKSKPVLTETWSGIWSITYKIHKWRTSVDYTGNVYGPMRLPTLGPNDPRPGYSPWWSIQNVQVTYRTKSEHIEIYGGVKNLLNFTPAANSIARANDPFDKRVARDANGVVIPTQNNPYALTFDPSYVYAPNQGIRSFIGIRMKRN